MLDPLLVALERPPLGLLHAPAPPAQKTTDMRTVVAHAELPEIKRATRVAVH